MTPDLLHRAHHFVGADIAGGLEVMPNPRIAVLLHDLEAQTVGVVGRTASDDIRYRQVFVIALAENKRGLLSNIPPAANGSLGDLDAERLFDCLLQGLRHFSSAAAHRYGFGVFLLPDGGKLGFPL